MQSRRLSSRCSPPLFRVFSGIQPTGSVHLGNYLGAVRRWVELQSQPHSSGQPEPIVLSVVDLHAITVRKAAEEVRGGAQNVLATLLACGIDPGKCLVFQQSAVPHHAELSWILSCLVSYNKLKTMTHFKVKRFSTTS